MGQKINPIIFNFTEKNNQQSKYFEKKLTECSIYSKIDLDIKKFCKTFFKNNNRTINNCNVSYTVNMLHIYIAYYQKIENNYINLNKNQKNKLIKDSFSNIKKSQQQDNKIKKSLDFVKLYKSKVNNKYWVTNSFLEIILFLESFFNSLTKFIKRKYNIFLMLKRQNTKTIIFEKKQNQTKNIVFIKRKQKLIGLRRYKQNSFFKDGINLLLSCINKSRNSSKLIAQFIAVQLKTLKQHNFFVRFIKSTLNVFNNKVFFSTIKGIKIQIKGRLNGNSRSKVKIITSAKKIPLLRKNLNINYFEEISFTLNGTFGIKVWVYQI